MPLCLPPTAPRRHQGFTLIELLVTIAIVAILAALAAPSFQTFIVRNTFSSIGNEFSGSILKARNEAVTKNICTTMCMSITTENDPPSCAIAGNDWQLGWMVFLNPDCNAALTTPAAEDLILVRKTGSTQYRLDSQRESPPRRIDFNPHGYTRLTQADEFNLIYIPSTDLTSAYGFNICLSQMGRTRSVPHSDTDCSF